MRNMLILSIILALAFIMAFIPHIGYAYPLHLDEWTHLTYSKTIVQTGSISFPDPFTGEGTVGPGSNVWLGYHVLMAMVQEASGIDWLVLWRFGPSFIFMLTVLCVYIFANKQGYGLEAAFFTCLIPTTVGLLGPAFMVPMALGLLLIPFSLYLAFYVKSWPSYLLLFLITCFLWSMHPTTAAIQGIVLLPFILITLFSSRGRGLGLLATLLLPIIIALPFTINKLLPAAGQMFSAKAVFPPPYLDLPALLQIYGFISIIFCFIGIIYLLKSGGKYNYALLLGLVLLLIIMLAFARFQVGMDTIFERGLSAVLLLIGIIAGAGLYWIRTQSLSERLLAKYGLRFTAYIGGLLCAISVVLILALAIPARLNMPYYHMIDDTDYRAFVWIRDNIGPDYGVALLDPWEATAFVAVTGKNVPHRVSVKLEPIDEMIYQFLHSGCENTAFLHDNSVTFVYNRSYCNNNDLININKDIYITNPNIYDSFESGTLLINGGFEPFWGNPPMYWYTWAQNCRPSFLYHEPGRNGGSCIAIQTYETEPAKSWPQANWAQMIPVEAGKSYYVGGWIKTENITGYGGAKIVVHWKGLKDKWIGAGEFMPYIHGQKEWTYYQGIIIAPPGTTTGTICCVMNGCSGTAWYDDILFKQ